MNEDIKKMKESGDQRFAGLTASDDELAPSDAFPFDADGDGKLTEDEVVAALTRKTGTELSEEAARATWKRWQYKYDLNNDGKISYGLTPQLTSCGRGDGPPC